MKTEDALFEKFELPQRGFQAKRKMAADKLLEEATRSCNNIDEQRALDALMREAQPAQEPVAHLWECLGRWSAYLVENGKQADCAPPSWLVDAINKATTSPLPVQSAQEPLAWVDLLKEAQQIVKSKFLWKKFIDGTPLANDIAFWMADFAQQYTAPPQRTWVGLTEEDCKGMSAGDKMVAMWANRILKERNS
jgi:hypothetical protein